MPRKSPSVVLVGRPNVGKSTLFNRMTGSRRAIVAPVAGTTRDALARPVVWRGTGFQLFDTGGLYGESQDPLHELVVQQGQRAIVGADLLVLLVDGREGLIPGDERIARELRETGTPILLAINKTDDKRSQKSSMEFFQLGFDPVTEISAEHGTGVAELLDEIVERLGANERRRTRFQRSVRTQTGVPQRRSLGPGSRWRNSSGNTRRDRRPPQRRKIVSRKQAAARGACARQRHAGNDARCDRHTADLAPASFSHHRHRGHAAPGAGRERRESGDGQRRAGEGVDRGRRRRRSCHRREHRRVGSGCGDRRRSRSRGTRRGDHREQVGPRENRGSHLRPALRRESPPRDAVPRLRADPAHLGAHRRADDQSARDDRQGCRRAADARADARR